MDRIHIPDVCERDIDLLLLEEFVSTPGFTNWFMMQLGAPGEYKVQSVHRSVKTPNGESDLELTLADGADSLKVLVENKVNACLQPSQPERYIERAQNYRLSGNYRDVICVVVAPSAYFKNGSDKFGFDAAVAYEDFMSWFKAATGMGLRREYKLKLLELAIDRGSMGYKLVPDARVSEFWQAYWQLAEKIAPELAMPVPKPDIPRGSHFIYFRPPELDSGVSLYHKVEYGHVDLQFAGMGDSLDELERRYRRHLKPEMRIEGAAKSAVIRIRMKPVDMTSEFSRSASDLRKAIEKVSELYRWYLSLPASELPGEAEGG